MQHLRAATTGTQTRHFPRLKCLAYDPMFITLAEARLAAASSGVAPTRRFCCQPHQCPTQTLRYDYALSSTPPHCFMDSSLYLEPRSILSTRPSTRRPPS